MEKLQPNSSYHIFNHANGFENIFIEDENYRFFLDKYNQYILPIAETYAYCLLPNHFHLVVRIRRREVLEEVFRNFKSTNFSKVQNFEKVEVTDNMIEYYISKQFANLFSCYTQSFNKVNKRRGSLFLKNFRREPIKNKAYFMNAVIYTHRNPVHHAFCDRYTDWSYTSFCEIKERNSQIIEVDKLLRMFGGRDSFIDLHEQSANKFRESLIADL
ncbi:transposase [Macellibacteroides fermentans]|uniref:transposase n=1 Tax=Macellibacteroides fermentans TaxID=879969 RepID=UPI00352F7525